MKWFIAILLVLAGLFYYPQVNESASTTCAATEKRFAFTAFEPKMVVQCSARYWQAVCPTGP